MKCYTNPKAIEHLASIGMADTVSKYIADLEAEVKRLTELNKKIMATADTIDASNQRLIKAGDEFVSLLEYEEYDMESAAIKDMVDAWNAAKNLNS